MTERTHPWLSASLLPVVLSGILAFIPIFAHAGIFSFVSGILSQNQAKAAENYNSQTAFLLEAALNVDPNPSKGGGDITVVDESALLPETGPYGTLADIKDRSKIGGQISIYVVRTGDTLSEIAQMFGVSVNTIIWGNNIKNGVIQEGETLAILPITGVRHTVKKGDTLKSITEYYKGDLNEILQYNGLTESSKLAIGDIVIIPDGVLVTPAYNGAPSVVGASGVSNYSGYYLRPVTNSIKSQGLHGYNGVDLAAPYGTPILASASGTVIVSRGAGWNGGYGNYIVITHDNGTQTLYAHNSQNIVYGGQYVVQGQVIGYVGTTGRSTGPHLHFEVRGAKNPF
ncbi:M23 family metallopeptidase [Candidatus Kaiserbacteria bacterium]|nr:M23 family metallopeptidase [Candidatus Kaiserbacteria bacterium]